jgi:hypothetical protein
VVGDKAPALPVYAPPLGEYKRWEGLPSLGGAVETKKGDETPALPVYVPSLGEYIREQDHSAQRGVGAKRAKRAARLKLAQLLLHLERGGAAPEPVCYPPRAATDASRLNAAPCAAALVRRLVREAAVAAAAALGAWAPAAFILVKGGAAMRFHFERVCAVLDPRSVAVLETGVPAAASAIEPSDFDVEVCVLPEVPDTFRHAVNQAMTELFKAKPGAEPEFEQFCAQFRQGATGPLYWKHQCDIYTDRMRHKLTLHRLQVLTATTRLEFFDLVVPAVNHPRLLHATEMAQKGELIDFPLSL